MKISKQQIYALAHRLYTEIDKISTEKELALKASILAKFKKSKEYTYVQKLNEMYQEGTGTPSQVISEASILAMCGYKHKYNKSYSLRDIENEILISTIECDNLDEIINKIKDKYK